MLLLRFNLEDVYVDQKKNGFFILLILRNLLSRLEVWLVTKIKKSLEINLQAYLDYNKTFGKHLVKGLLGYSQIHNQI